MIVIVCMRRWGELGNYLCATQLKDYIESTIKEDAKIICADDFVKIFHETGINIKKAVRGSIDSNEVRNNYKLVVNSLHEKICKDELENNYTAYAELFSEVNKHSPNLVLCTKGVVARIIEKNFNENTVIANYVTNHGHFSLSLHTCSNQMKYITRFPAASDFLRNECSVSPKNIYQFGYISSLGAGLPDSYITSKKLKNILIVSNRGNDDYFKLFKEVVLSTDLNVHFVIVNDSEQVGRAKRLAKSKPRKAFIYHGLRQNDYYSLLSRVGSDETIFVGKGSINTLIEALLSGFPVLGLSSGLPMEDWGEEFLNEHSIGYISHQWTDILENIKSIELNIQSFESYKENILRFLNSKSIQCAPNPCAINSLLS